MLSSSNLLGSFPFSVNCTGMFTNYLFDACFSSEKEDFLSDVLLAVAVSIETLG